MRLEYNSEVLKKFWEPEKEENTIKVRFDKIGAEGRTHTKEFSSPEKAQSEYRKLIREKLAKGYKPTRETVAQLLREVAPVETPTAIGSLCIGHLVPDEVTQDICGWATACIQHGMTPKQFESVWYKFMEEPDEEILEVAFSRTGEEFWHDVTDWSDGQLSKLYAKAVENGGDKFIWYDDGSAYIYIVALRGDPGARAIEVCALGEENCKDEKGQWLSNWPAELGPGAPIASMSVASMPGDEVTLRD